MALGEVLVFLTGVPCVLEVRGIQWTDLFLVMLGVVMGKRVCSGKGSNASTLKMMRDKRKNGFMVLNSDFGSAGDTDEFFMREIVKTDEIRGEVFDHCKNFP